MKTGKTFWMSRISKKGIRMSVVPPAMDRSPDSIWKRLFTTNASVVIGKIRRKRKKRVPVIAGNVMYENEAAV
jgi:hypothetical protein